MTNKSTLVRNTNVAIKVSNLHKSFKLPHETTSGAKQALLNIFKKNKKKGYEIQHVLKGIDFTVNKGDFFGIVGRNGSGKSTLLKLLSGIYSPNEGEIVADGSIVPFIELGVGFNPELTGRENIFLNGALLGFSRNEMLAMYDEIVEFAELEKFMDQKLKNYSSGMQVRLAFSIAIKAQGDILILDEVLAVGDEDFQRKCNNFFAQIKKDKSKTVILVTHSMGDVKRYCNKALLLEKGKIISMGDPDSVAEDYSKQFIENSNTSIKEKNRYGTGEVVYQNITYKLSKDYFTLDFDILNKTKQVLSGITMGFDFCINGDIIIGNDTRFMDQYKAGIQLEPSERRHFTIKFDNNFGNYPFTLNTNITTGLGVNVTDHMRPALKFTSNNVKYSNAFKALSFPEINESSRK
jgi:ABC-type polysaccharide/polyol phosphate transport system ATPase subunit